VLAADMTIKLDLPYGAVDYAFLEEVVSHALRAANIPVVDVEMDGIREVDAPLPQGVPAPDFPLGPAGAPRTPLPGAPR
jgi:hypothetical protein